MSLLIKIVLGVLAGSFCIYGSFAETLCGRVLTGSVGDTGSIDYKNDTYYRNNERCVWTIRIPDATQIHFNFSTFNTVVDEYDGLWITSLARSASNASALVHQQKLLINGTQTLTLDGNLAVVTFFSNVVATLEGFHLEFTGIGESTSQNISSSSQDFILKTTSTNQSVEINHPAEGFYSDQELSTFVITYPDFQRPPGTTLEAEVHVDFHGDCDCSDALIIYEFSAADGWTILDIGSICCGDAFMHRNDILLFVFKSDEQGVATGLTLKASFNP